MNKEQRVTNHSKWAIFTVAMFLIFYLFLSGKTWAQRVIEPWVKPTDVRNLYVIGDTYRFTGSDGKPALGFALLKHSIVEGSVEAIDMQAFRWVDRKGEPHVIKVPSSKIGLLSETPLILYPCTEGECKGWTFVKPPFNGVTVLSPTPKAPDPAPAPPEPRPVPAPPVARPPSVIDTSDIKNSIYRREDTKAYNRNKKRGGR